MFETPVPASAEAFLMNQMLQPILEALRSFMSVAAGVTLVAAVVAAVLAAVLLCRSPARSGPVVRATPARRRIPRRQPTREPASAIL